MEQQYYDIEHYFWQALSRESTSIHNDVFLYVNTQSYPLFNFMYLHQLCLDDFKYATDWMNTRRSHYFIVAHEKVAPFLYQHQTEFNLQLDSITVAMGLDLTQYIHHPRELVMNNSLEIVLEEKLSQWINPLRSAFAVDDIEIIKQYQHVHQLAVQKGYEMYHFVLLHNGHAVTSLTLTVKDDLARLDDIGTVVEYQHRGYATYIIQCALSFAQSKGAHSCFLEASGNGLKLYEQLGFQALFRYHTFLH